MSPGPLVKARWRADEGDAELVLYDSGELKVHSDGLEYPVATPWSDTPEEPPVEPTDGGE